MKRSGREFHSEAVRDSIELDKIHAIRVLHCHAESDILHAHLAKLLESRVASVEAIGKSSDRVVGLLKAFDGNADSDVREFLTEVDNSISEETVR